MMLELNLLGAPRLTYSGEPLEVQKKHLALLCYTALEGPRPRDELTELLWGAGRGGSLRTALYKLRQLPGADTWLVDGEFVEVRAKSDWGVLASERDGETLSDAALAQLDICLHGANVLLFGFKAPTPAYSEWLEEQRQRAAFLLDDLLKRAAHTRFERGELTQAKVYTEELIARDPLDESAYRLLMRLEHERGYPESVHHTFERLRLELEPLGSSPSTETLALHRQLLGTGSGARGALLGAGDEVPGRAPQLVGRSVLLEKMQAQLSTHAVLLHGFGGAGKTALAAEVAANVSSRGDVLWLHAGQSSAAELIGAAGQLLGLPGAAQPEALTQALGRVSLVVIDDVWNEQALSAFRQGCPKHLPLLVTARQHLPGFKRLDVGRLGRGDARLLLRLDGADFPDAQLEPICDLLGDHPFALRVAAAKLKYDHLTPPQLLAQLADAPHTLGRESRGEANSVSALLQTSLSTLSDDAYDAFLAVGAFASSSVTAPLLARALRRDEEVAEAALIELQTRALATRTASPGSDLARYTLHDLSHSFARQKTVLRPQTVLRACRDLVRADPKDFEILDAEMGNIVGALSAFGDAQVEERRTVLSALADLVIGDAYFSARGHTPRSLRLLEVAAGWAEELGELERAHFLAGKLGDAYRVQYHEFTKALRAYTEGARLARLVKDTAREAILTSLCGIAQHHLGKPPEETFERAYQLAQQSGEALTTVLVLQHRGYVATFYRNWNLVERLNVEAVRISRSSAETPHIGCARADELLFFSLLNLGEAKRKLDFFEEAVTDRKAALDIAMRRENQMWQACALHELGEMYLEVDRHKEAECYLNEAMSLYRANHAAARVEQVQVLIDKNSRRVDA